MAMEKVTWGLTYLGQFILKKKRKSADDKTA